MQVAGVFWRENSDHTYDKGLEVWIDGDDKLGVLPLKPGDRIKWTVTGPKMCIGYRSIDGVSTKCPEKAIARTGMARCGPCNALDGSSQCIRCSGSDCRAGQERRLACSNTDYAVYLALFGSDRVKVGVSSAARLRTRWVEQGTDYGVHLAKVRGGMAARRLEHAIGRVRSLTKVVRGTTKMSTLLNVMEASEVQRAVETVLSEGKITPDSIRKFGAEAVEWPPRVSSLSSVYGLGNLGSSVQQMRPRGLMVEGMTVLGQVVGMKGSLLVLHVGDTMSVVDVRQFIGKNLDSDTPASVVTQASLSEFV